MWCEAGCVAVAVEGVDIIIAPNGIQPVVTSGGSWMERKREESIEVLGIEEKRQREEKRKRKREKMRFNAGFAEPSSVIGPDQREKRLERFQQPTPGKRVQAPE